MSRAERLPISVVIPTYNCRATLPRAVASVAGQIRLPAEVVVVDDGSEDGTTVEDVLAAAGGTVPARLVHQPNAGPSRARNHGVALAKQPWIAFLDADDAWEPEKLRCQWAVVRAGPGDLVLVSTDWRRPGEAARRRAGGTPRVYRDGVRRILWHNQFQTSTVLLRRDAFEQVGGFDPSLDGAEDWDLWLRLAALGPWAHLPAPLVRYADNPAGVSKDLERLYRTGLAMLARYRRGEGDPRIARAVGERVLVWHHLRFAWAFSRLGNRDAARRCLAQARLPGRRLRLLEVGATRLLPFLCRRLLRRAFRASA